jgi:hypothetical protein
MIFFFFFIVIFLKKKLTIKICIRKKNFKLNYSSTNILEKYNLVKNIFILIKKV